MSDRGRHLALFLPVVVTVVLAAVIGASVVVQQQKQSDRLAAADAAAESYLSDVGMFKGSVAREIRGARTAEPAALLAGLLSRRHLLLRLVGVERRRAGAAATKHLRDLVAVLVARHGEKTEQCRH